MDINMVRGALLIALMLAFLGMWIWAWSRKRKPEFDEMARMPLEEDFGEIPEQTSAED